MLVSEIDHINYICRYLFHTCSTVRQPVAKEENSSENTDNGKDIDECNEFKKSFVNKEHVALHARYAHL